MSVAAIVIGGMLGALVLAISMLSVLAESLPSTVHIVLGLIMNSIILTAFIAVGAPLVVLFNTISVSASVHHFVNAIRGVGHRLADAKYAYVVRKYDY